MRLKPETNMLLISALLIVAIFWAGVSDDDMAKCEKRMSRETCIHELLP